MEGRFRFLGTGSSVGIPVIGCKCPVCLSNDPKNKRTRSGGMVYINGKSFLIDVSPDYREQALKYKIDSLDGFILTHSHYDHMGGFDDLKIYASAEKKLPCFMLEKTFEEWKSSYGYFIQPSLEDRLWSPFFSWQIAKEAYGKCVFECLAMQYLSFYQKGMQVMGLKIGGLAYISDIKEYTPELIKLLEGTETLIISALRKTTSPMHFSVEEALQFISLINPKKAYLTHIAHEIDHESLLSELPHFVSIAYDGLEIFF